MNRLELYRQRKRNKRLFYLVIFLSLLIVVVGFVTVDYAVNSMLGVEEKLSIIRIEKTGDPVYALYFMNNRGIIDLRYIKKDFNKVVEQMSNSYEEVKNNILELKDYAQQVMNLD
ncbi:MAG: hypothetical protein GX066_10510 [Clostridiaceae bacterium]|nr:hypothetical protein [Clostridiaceae bacterium]